jgi:hypothetical protein
MMATTNGAQITRRYWRAHPKLAFLSPQSLSTNRSMMPAVPFQCHDVVLTDVKCWIFASSRIFIWSKGCRDL